MLMWIVPMVVRLYICRWWYLSIDFVGGDTFVLDVSSEFDFFGFSYDRTIR